MRTSSLYCADFFSLLECGGEKNLPFIGSCDSCPRIPARMYVDPKLTACVFHTEIPLSRYPKINVMLRHAPFYLRAYLIFAHDRNTKLSILSGWFFPYLQMLNHSYYILVGA